MSVKLKFGRLSMLFKDAYSPSLTYHPLDVVTYENNSYICKKETTAGISPDNTEYWGVIAKSITGPQGPAGEAGPTGPAGPKGDTFSFDDLTEEQKAELKGTFDPEMLEEYAKKTDVSAAIDALVGSAPGTLDTIYEIAELLQSNDTSIGALFEEIALKANKDDVYDKDYMEENFLSHDALDDKLIPGPEGPEGKSAYEVYVNSLDDPELALPENEWLESLKAPLPTIGKAEDSDNDADIYWYINNEQTEYRAFPKVVSMTEQDYADLEKKEEGTLYVISDSLFNRTNDIIYQIGNVQAGTTVEDISVNLRREGNYIYFDFIIPVANIDFDALTEAQFNILRGKSNYDIYKENHVETPDDPLLTETEWLESINIKGDSAYDIYVKDYYKENGSNDGVLSEEDWLRSLAPSIVGDGTNFYWHIMGKNSGYKAMPEIVTLTEQEYEDLGDEVDPEIIYIITNDILPEGFTFNVGDVSVAPSIDGADVLLRRVDSSYYFDFVLPVLSPDDLPEEQLKKIMGKSAYDLYVEELRKADPSILDSSILGQAAWVESLKGLSAYDVYVEQEKIYETPDTSILSKVEWLNSLKVKGDKGDLADISISEDGYWIINGTVTGAYSKGADASLFIADGLYIDPSSGEEMPGLTWWNDGVDTHIPVNVAASGNGGFNVSQNPNTKVFGLVNSLSKNYNTSIGEGAVIEGAGGEDNYLIAAFGKFSHAEGYGTQVYANYSHAEGYLTKVTEVEAHAEGYYSIAAGSYSHAEGGMTFASGSGSHAEGYETSVGASYGHAEGINTNVYGYAGHAEGANTSAGQYSHAEGSNTRADGYSHAEGANTYAYNYSHAEGWDTSAGDYSHAEGRGTYAKGTGAHAEGQDTSAGGTGAHAEGYRTYAKDQASHAEGNNTSAGAPYAHAEGYYTVAASNAYGSHVEGYYSLTLNSYAHAEGYNTSAGGMGAHAEGGYTKTQNNYEHASGYYNISLKPEEADKSLTTVFTVGNGLNDDNRHNAFQIMQSGEIYIADTTKSGEAHELPMIKLQDMLSGGKGGFNVIQNPTTEVYGLINSLTKNYNTSIGEGAVIEGEGGSSSLFLGNNLIEATGKYSHAEGFKTRATGSYSHAEGYNTSAGDYAHAEGLGTKANGYESHAEGYNTTANGTVAHAEGLETSAGQCAHAEGDKSIAFGQYAHAEGHETFANMAGHAEGWNTSAGDYAHAEGYLCIADYYGHAEGYQTYAKNNGAHAEGKNTSVFKDAGHAEGFKTKVYAYAGHVEGYECIAGVEGNSHYGAHAEGYYTFAGAQGAHAEGQDTSALESNSHAEGNRTIASNSGAHAEGFGTVASGFYSHAEGNTTYAIGAHSHSEGNFTKANNNYEHASGTYNISLTPEEGDDKSQTTLFTVGNGKDDDNRHNALQIMQDGTIYIPDIYDVSTDECYEKPMLKLQDFAAFKLYRSSDTSVGVVCVLNTREQTNMGHRAFSIGNGSFAGGDFSVATGLGSEATGQYAFVGGGGCKATGSYSFAYGAGTIASGMAAFAFGSQNEASGINSFASGNQAKASGEASHAEGISCKAFGVASHAEGNNTSAGKHSHSEGNSTFANEYSHSEGYETKAHNYSHAEGWDTSAYNFSHAEGYGTIAVGFCSHADGFHTIAVNRCEHASGHYNMFNSNTEVFGDSENTLFTVGNGFTGNYGDTSVKHNAFQIMQSGDIYIADPSSAGEYYEKSMIHLQQKLASLADKEEVDQKLAELEENIKVQVYAEEVLISEEDSSTLMEYLDDTEKVIAAALTDLNSRLEEIEMLKYEVREIAETIQNLQGGNSGTATGTDTYFTGCNKSTAINNIPVSKHFTTVTISEGGTFQLEADPEVGRELHIIIKNTSNSAINVQLPEKYAGVSDGTEIAIEANAFVDMNLIYDGETYYIKAMTE